MALRDCDCTRYHGRDVIVSEWVCARVMLWGVLYVVCVGTVECQVGAWRMSVWNGLLWGGAHGGRVCVDYGDGGVYTCTTV